MPNLASLVSRERFIRRSLGGVAAAGSTLLALPAARAAEPTTLKLAQLDPPGSPFDLAAHRFAEGVNRRTGGRYVIQVYSAGQLGSNANQTTNLQTGVIDFLITTSAYMESVVPSVQAIDLPFIFKSTAAAERILDGPIGRGLFDEFVPRGIVGLAWGWDGVRVFETRDKGVPEPADIKGLRIRIQPGPAFEAMVKTLDAVPVIMDVTEAYLALQQKAIDGTEVPVDGYVNNKIFEVAKFVTISEHVYNACPLLAGKARFDTFSAADQRAVREAAMEALPYWRQQVVQHGESQRRVAEQSGVKFVACNRAAYRAKMEPVYAQFRPKFPELLNKINAAQ